MRFSFALSKFALRAAVVMGVAPFVHANPVLQDPARFKIELYADLSALGFHTKSLQLTVTGGENGFPSGLYVTSPFTPSPNPDRLLHISGPGAVSVVTDSLDTPENVLFARGAYGAGMLISDPANLRIQRLLANGTLSTMANLGTAPFGPTGMTFGASNQLYVTDFSSGNILSVNPDGSFHIFASIPIPTVSNGIGGAKPVLHDPSGRYGGGLIVGTFSVTDSLPSQADAVYKVSSDGSSTSLLASGFSGLEFMALGSGGGFGSDLYISTLGGDFNGDGVVATITPEGDVIPFLTSVDATHVAFDQAGVLGGGMFVSDFNESVGSARIWHVTEVAEPDSWAMTISGLLVMASAQVRARGWWANRRRCRAWS